MVVLLHYHHHQTSALTTGQFLERIIGQMFSQVGVDTLIIWDVVGATTVGVKHLPYPKIIYDRRMALSQTLRETCLVVMEFNETPINDISALFGKAFTGANKHYQAKYLVLLDHDASGLSRKVSSVDYFFKVLQITQYAIAIHSTQLDTVGTVGYPASDEFVYYEPTDDLGNIFDARLRGLPFRAIITESKPFTFMGRNREYTGLDVEIAKIVTRALGLRLFFTRMHTTQADRIQNLLYDRKVDVYLTRRGCNTQINLPAVHLHQRTAMRLMMPRSLRINFNLQFLKPYKSEVWYLLLGLLLAICVLNWLFRNRLGSVNVLMMIIFGHSRETTRLTALLVVVVQFLKFILLETYLGQVTSFMIQLRYQENPQTLEQFFESGVLLAMPTEMNRFLLHLPERLAQRLRPILRVQPMDDDDHWTYDPRYAYMVSEYASDTLEGEFSEELNFDASQFYIMREPLHEIEMCYLFGVWSRFVVEYKKYLEWLYASGIMLKLTRDAWRLAGQSLRSSTSTVLLFTDLVPVFFFLCYGWALSLLMFTLEHVTKHSRMRCWERFPRCRLPIVRKRN
ncbi:uncharacterized protein LOC128724751 [Anopheles nili]|uniref:uncharacterized protein LOC128724751 n=1 Tax=Anopheles nili TaxID=185578 RepID=UPI00237B1153|nr:uncharacterized protein LOC128724751 [Anopheles nili]